MEDGNAVVAANGTVVWRKHTIGIPFPHQVSGTHKTRLLTSPLMVAKIMGAKQWIDGQPVLWPPIASKGHPYTIDIWNNRYRMCCTCDKWFVHNPRWCGGCKRVVYCSTDCQTRDWNEHKYKCAHYIQNRVNIVTCGRAANRLISEVMMEHWSELTIEYEEARAKKQETNCICTGCRRKYKDPCKHLLSPDSEEEGLCWECRSELTRSQYELEYVLEFPSSSSSGAASSSS